LDGGKIAFGCLLKSDLEVCEEPLFVVRLYLLYVAVDQDLSKHIADFRAHLFGKDTPLDTLDGNLLYLVFGLCLLEQV
jgi:hypothetical protein